MKQLDCVLGIDMGTGGARVGIFDLKGTPIVFCEEPYPLYTPASGRAEQNPDEWWRQSVRRHAGPSRKVALIHPVSRG